MLYVFAHTRGTPYQWSYRTRTRLSPDSAGTWTSWQPLGLDIPSDQVVPVVWDSRLHLVWPIFGLDSEKAAERTIPTTTSGGSAPPAQTFWAVQFAISELSAGQWQPKRVLDEKMFFTKAFSARIDLPADAFTFRASVDASNALIIFAYCTDVRPAAQKGALLGNAKVGTGALASPEAPLGVIELERAMPDSSIVDLSQEPTFALVQDQPPLSGSLATPPGATFSGQEWIAGTYDDPVVGTTALSVFAPASSHTSSATAQPLLGEIVGPHVVVVPRETPVTSQDWFFVADSGASGSTSPRPARTYLVESPGSIAATITGASAQNTMIRLTIGSPIGVAPRLAFSTFYHPFARTMLRELERADIPALMAVQAAPATVRGWSFDFKNTFAPEPIVATPYPGQAGASDVGESALDFAPGSSGAYSLYNWEIFYHAPMFVAELLMQNQQYGDAMTWLEYIFDPMSSSAEAAPQRFWQTAPLNAMRSSDWSNQQIGAILDDVANGTADASTATSLDVYMTDPFDPHAIASLRIAAYGKATVMKFLDNLIAWGDSLFTTYTAETVNQAEQLYILADLILGPKPADVRMPPQPAASQETYASIVARLAAGDFSDPLVAVENLVIAPTPPQSLVDGTSSSPTLPTVDTLLFCVPPNQQMLSYWDTVADRLYKIRHCLDLQGQPVPLPLYAPPINPLLAIQAAQAGTTPPTTSPALIYRFSVYSQKALELANEVRQFGSLILSALEKKDGETLALLRATQELDIQTRLLDVKTKQITEATDQIAALQNQKAMTQIRYEFYSTIAYMNAWEGAAMELQAAATIMNAAAVVLDQTAGPASLAPSFTFGGSGFGGSPVATGTYGGRNIADAASSEASALRGVAGIYSETAGVVGTMGGYQRRADEWQLQANLANAELTQIDSQIAAANDRLAIAQSELAIQSQTITNAQAIRDFLANKYTQVELYDWMVSQLTTVHAQAYQLAYGLALVAQAAYQNEIGMSDTFINYGWDAQHRGLVAGESLVFDLRRMETQYLANNTRELELTKHVSLALTQPEQLLTLIQTGTCQIALDEALFDADHPGHYFRRLRDVSVTVPFVGGPYTGANATLQLTAAVVRLKPPPATSTYTPVTATAPPSTSDFAATSGETSTLISTSTGQNDSGLFEVNLRDERYLPFEGRGAISAWSLELNPADNAFDFSTITDVVLHVRYTAQVGGDAATVRKGLTTPRPQAIYISTKASFGLAYDSFFAPASGATQQVLTLPLSAKQIPFSNLGEPQLTRVDIYVMLAAPPTAPTTLAATFGPTGGSSPSNVALAGSATAGISMLVASVTSSASALQSFDLTVPTSPSAIPSTLATTVSGTTILDRTKIDDIVLVIRYTV